MTTFNNPNVRPSQVPPANPKVDVNADPLTGAPGAHPTGVGIGAAVGGAIGGTIGAIGGPAGIVAGAAVGGTLGGLVGKGAAEAVNPTDEVAYWRTQFPNRPYAAGRNFEEYEPAYYYTASMYAAAPAVSFADVEADLERGWMDQRRSSRLSWQEARDASRDAWERLAERTKKTTPKQDHEAAHVVNDVLKTLHDGRLGFQQAAEKVSSPKFRSGFLEFAAQRQRFIDELTPLVAQRGEVPNLSGSMLGSLHRGWIALKASLTSGDKAILAACEAGEDSSVEKYREALEAEDMTADLRNVLQRQFPQIQSAHDTVRDWRDSL